MTRAKTVLVPLDGSVQATTAVPVARELGELYHATVAVFHVTDDALASAALVDRMSLSSEDVRGLVVERSPGAAAVAIVREAAEREAALIVMCPRTRTDRGAPDFGTVAEAVLRAAPCPVVLVPPTRGRGHWALRRLLLPHDGTPTSAAVIGRATQLRIDGRRRTCGTTRRNAWYGAVHRAWDAAVTALCRPAPARVASVGARVSRSATRHWTRNGRCQARTRSRRSWFSYHQLRAAAQ